MVCFKDLADTVAVPCTPRHLWPLPSTASRGAEEIAQAKTQRLELKNALPGARLGYVDSAVVTCAMLYSTLKRRALQLRSGALVMVFVDCVTTNYEVQCGAARRNAVLGSSASYAASRL